MDVPALATRAKAVADATITFFILSYLSAKRVCRAVCNQSGNWRLNLIALAGQGFEERHQVCAGSRRLLQRGKYFKEYRGFAKLTLLIEQMEANQPTHISIDLRSIGCTSWQS